MNVIKRITRAVSAWLLAFSLFALASFAALTITLLNPSFIKSSLVKANVYDHVVPATLNLATNVSYQQQPGEISNNQTLTELTPVIEQTITPVFLRSTTESIINGTFVWLKGGADWPNFSIDITAMKTNLVANITNYLVKRVNALPVCKKYDTSQSFDPVNATCRPNVSFSSEQFRQSALDFVNSFPPLQQNTLTIDTAYARKTFANDKPISKAPQVYFWLTKTMYLFAALTVTSVMVLVIVSNPKYKTWRTVGHTFIVAGIMLIITAGVTYVLLNRFGHQFIGNASKEQLDFVNTIFSPLSQQLSKALANTALAFGVGYAVIGAVCYALAHKLELNFKSAQPETPAEQIKNPPVSE